MYAHVLMYMYYIFLIILVKRCIHVLPDVVIDDIISIATKIYHIYINIYISI